MENLQLRVPDRIKVEHLVEDMTRETWGIFRRAAGTAVLPPGVFGTVRSVLRQFVWERITTITRSGHGFRTLSFSTGAADPDEFGLEAAATALCAHEDVCREMSGITRMARRIAKAIEGVIEPYRVATFPAATGRSAFQYRTVLARAAGEPGLRPG